MGARDALRIQQASTFPCPYCDATAGFRPGPAGFSGWARAAAVGVATVVVNPKAAVVASTNGGMIARCRSCGRQVEICGACDHPNHSGEIPRRCSNCGAYYSA
jgi:hypothetical protein